MAIATNTRFGNYEVISQIGAGGMGEVYRARDTRLGRQVAIKILPAEFSGDSKRFYRFEQEARAASALNHPNILTVYDVGTHEGVPYLITEFLEGETLRARLRESALPQRKAIDYALQIAEGLAAAHEKGIVHRDLKPENIFVTRDGRVKILDFGLAKLTRAQSPTEVDTTAPTVQINTEPGQIVGTTGYMSPEQVRGLEVDHRSDIFSFGCVLYEMLTGKQAFKRDSSVETLNAILKEEPPDLVETNSQIAPGLDRIVRHCLEKRPEERFQSASDLAFALESLSGFSDSALKSRPMAALKPKRRMLPLLIGSGVIALLGLSFFLGRYTGQKPASIPSFNRLTFRRGNLSRARLTPDGQSVVYSASWEGKPVDLYTTRVGSPESRSLGLPNAGICAISTSGEMAIQLLQADHATLALVPFVGGTPREILDYVQSADWSPDGKNLVVLHTVQNQRRIEYPAGKVLYESPFQIFEVRFSPKGDLIAFPEASSNGLSALSVIDLSGKKRTLTEGWRRIAGMAWSPDGNEVWFTASRQGPTLALYAVDLSGKERLVIRVPGKLAIQDISRDGHVLLEHDIAQTSMMFLAPGEKKERELSWLDASQVRDISSDGKLILFNERGEGGGENSSIYIRNSDGSPAIRLGEGIAMSLSPDSKWVLAINNSTTPQQLILMPTGAGETRALERGNIQSYQTQAAGWFADGRRIFFTGVEPNHQPRLYVQDVAGGPPQPILSEGISPGLVSPDGKLAVALGPDRLPLLYSVEGGEPRQLPGIERGDSALRWSNDSSSIYIGRSQPLPGKIFRLDIATGRSEQIAEIMPPEPDQVSGLLSGQVTPDGKSYAYSYAHVLSTLYLVDGLK